MAVNRARPCPVEKRRVGRVVYSAALEMRLGRNPLTGSNPVPSAFLQGQEKVVCEFAPVPQGYGVKISPLPHL